MLIVLLYALASQQVITITHEAEAIQSMADFPYSVSSFMQLNSSRMALTS